MEKNKSYVNMDSANPVLTDAPVLKEETEMSGANENKITALYT